MPAINSQGNVPIVPAQGSFTYTNVLGAGATIQLAVTGTQFYLPYTTDTLYIRPLPGGSFIPYDQGTGLDLAAIGQGIFNLLEIQNQTLNNVTFRLFVGFAGFIDKRTYISSTTGAIYTQNQNTVLVGSNLASINGTTTISFPGNANGNTKRKQWWCCNKDNVASLEVWDSNNNIAGTIFPLMPFSLETSDVIKLRNPNGGAVAISAGEVYYAV